jgi:hypothetical protein
MAIFGDMRADSGVWTVEFFNSTGRLYDELIEYLSLATNDMKKVAKAGIEPKPVLVCDVQHQKSRSECGPYSMYYIWSRINGVPYEAFNKRRVPDERMYEFRNFLFRDTR